MADLNGQAATWDTCWRDWLETNRGAVKRLLAVGLHTAILKWDGDWRIGWEAGATVAPVK